MSKLLRIVAGAASARPSLPDSRGSQSLSRGATPAHLITHMLATRKETCETGADAKVSPAAPPPKRVDQVALRKVTKLFDHAFQTITSIEEYAELVERYLQAVVDRRAWDGYRALVKVTVVKDSSQASHA